MRRSLPRLASALLTSLALGLLAITSVVAAPKDAPGTEPFVERIQPINFAETEELFETALTKSHSLVILQTSSGRPITAVALNREAAGDYTVTLRAPPATPGGDWLEVAATLPGNVGYEVERAIAFTLSRHVLVAPMRRPPSDDNAAVWLYHRVPGTTDSAGVISWSAVLNHPAAKRLVDGLLAPMQRLPAAADTEREPVIKAIDLAATEIILRADRK